MRIVFGRVHARLVLNRPCSQWSWFSRFTPVFFATCVVAAEIFAQAQQPPSTKEKFEAGGYIRTQRGLNHRVWAKVESRTNANGNVSLHTNRMVVELATGLHRWETNSAGAYLAESKPQIIVSSNGIVAQGAAHSAGFASNFNSYGATRIRLPGGQILRSHILGLAYHDVTSGSNVMFAVPQDSPARLVGSNRVLYQSAFTDMVDADVLYTYTKAGIAQDIRFRSRPPSPAEYGLRPASTHLIVITEFIGGPVPIKTERTWKSGLETMRDETLDFGEMRMIPGYAFRGTAVKKRLGVPVAKTFETLSGRTVVLERVQYGRIKDQLDELPLADRSATNTFTTLTNANIAGPPRWFASFELPPAPNEREHFTEPVIKVSALSSEPNFIIDFEMVLNWYDWEFYPGTYVVDGDCYLFTAVFYGDSVVKYEPGSSLWIDGPSWYSGYSLLTSVNDDNDGEVLEWSNHSPVDPEYGPALMVRYSEWYDALEHLEVRYADPEVIYPPALPTVTLNTLDPHAVKGNSDATLRISRSGGNWSQPLTVQFVVGGTAVQGIDYDAIANSAVIEQNAEWVDVVIHPTTGSLAFQSTVVLTLQSSSSYVLGSSTTAIASILDPLIPTPPPGPTPWGLIALWSGVYGLDRAGFYNGGVQNGLDIEQAYVAEGLVFDGIDDRLTVSDSPSLDFGPNADFSIEAWIRPVQATTAYGVQSIVDKRYTPNDWSAVGYSLHLVNGRVECQLAQGPPPGSYQNFGPAGPDLRDGFFHHVTVTVDRESTSGLKLYVDGVQVGTSMDPTGRAGDLSNSAQLRIGNHASDTLNAYFKGIIDEVSLYNRALSATEIKAIYNAGRGGKATPDVDGDGLPDYWEMQRFGNLSQSATDDPDSDGFTNFEEFKLGKDPGVQNAASPIFTPQGGSYSSPQNVVISCATPGAVIRYTLNGQDPTAISPQYQGNPILVDQNLTLKAKAFYIYDSDVVSQSYRIESSPSNLSPMVSIAPDGGSFPASDSIPLLVEASDPDGTITKVQLFRNDMKIAESTTALLWYTINNIPLGSYTYRARAVDNAGAVGLSPAITITVAAAGPTVSLRGLQPSFTSSPGTLVAKLTGIDPGSLASLTLNGQPILPMKGGELMVSVPLTEGQNTFTLVATDNLNRVAQSTATVYLDSLPPVVSITSPTHGISINTTRINVSGTFTEANLKRINVNGVVAFISGNTFSARNVPLELGANTIIASVEDVSGNSYAASISITGVPGGGGNLINPVQLQATPVGGFAPLNAVLQAIPNVPGTIGNVLYDFDGDNGIDESHLNDFTPVPHTYSTPGEFFPVVTVETSVGRFSSLGGWNTSSAGQLRMYVQQPASQDGPTISISDPVDLKTTPANHLYVLSRSLASITEYDANAANAVVRSISGIGSAPRGFDVDNQGNVYVALSGNHQAAKYKPQGGTFILDTRFNGTGRIGKSDQTAGNGPAEFNAPFDVAVDPVGAYIVVSDSNNNRVQRFTTQGVFLSTFGSSGIGLGQFNSPKGLAFDEAGYLYVVDSANNRISLFLESSSLGTSGGPGIALGEFQVPFNIALGRHGIYVADTSNHRVQHFDPIPRSHGAAPTPFRPRGAVSAEFLLNQPNSVTATMDLLEERLYIADTGNNRVLVIKFPIDEPEAVWDLMKQHLINQNISAALPYFAAASMDRFRNTFNSMDSVSLSALMAAIPLLTPVFVGPASAQYRFDRVAQGFTITFPVDFVKENGSWRILMY